MCLILLSILIKLLDFEVVFSLVFKVISLITFAISSLTHREKIAYVFIRKILSCFCLITARASRKLICYV